MYEEAREQVIRQIVRVHVPPVLGALTLVRDYVSPRGARRLRLVGQCVIEKAICEAKSRVLLFV